MKTLSIMASAAVLFAMPAWSDHLTVPAGTEIAIRTNDTINSETAREGETFSAMVAEDVRDAGGRVIIPRGSDARLMIREFDRGGAAGTRELELDLESVRVNGRSYYVGASTQAGSEKSGLGANKRTATMTGGGAALGAIIGAIAGGGKGAAIGAITGAGAGAAAQVMTRGDKVTVPAESVLTFRLQNSVDLHDEAPQTRSRRYNNNRRTPVR